METSLSVIHMLCVMFLLNRFLSSLSDFKLDVW